jgi:hypothetical protein
MPGARRLLQELACSDRRVRELAALAGQPQNLLAYHLGQLRADGLVTSRRSSFDGRHSYYRLDLARCALSLAAAGTTLHPRLRLGPSPPTSLRTPPPARFSGMTPAPAQAARSPAIPQHSRKPPVASAATLMHGEKRP